MSEENLVDNLRDMAYIIDESQGKAVVTMLSGSMFNEAADEIERLREEVDEERQTSNLFESLAAESAEEINRLTQDVDRLMEEINDLRLQVVALSIPTISED